MADNSRPVAEPLQKGAQAAQAVRGAVKTGKAIAGAAKGAAAGGVWGAVAGFAWENRKFVGKVIIAATAVLMIPILILCMLPGIIFGGFGNSHSPADPDTPIMNSSAVIDSNLTEISTAVSRVLSEALTDTLSAIDNDYAACTLPKHQHELRVPESCRTSEPIPAEPMAGDPRQQRCAAFSRMRG